MTNLHDARVEAACVAYEYTNAFGPERETRMRAALAAADAVVTEEMIAEVLDAHLVDRAIKFDSDGFREWTCRCGNVTTADEPHSLHRARAVLALFRGGDGDEAVA